MTLLDLDSLLANPSDCELARQRIADRVCIDQESGCHVWTGSTGGLQPRARFILRQQGNYAYRVAWVLAKGRIPAGMSICHHCDNPLCVNVDHLFLGTHADNMRDMRTKGRGRIPQQVSRETSPRTKYDATVVCEALQSLAAGNNSATIGRRLGCDPSTVRFWQRRYGTDCPSCSIAHCPDTPRPDWSRQYGELSPRHRLTDAQVADIRSRFEPATTLGGRSNAAELAAEFGVSKPYLARLAKGQCRLRATPVEVSC